MLLILLLGDVFGVIKPEIRQRRVVATQHRLDISVNITILAVTTYLTNESSVVQVSISINCANQNQFTTI